MAIENGSVANADDVMKVYGSMFNDTIQNIFNADYIGLNLNLDLSNTVYDTFQTDSMNITGNIEYDADNDYYWGPNSVVESEYIVYDDCDDSVVNTSLWTTTTTNHGYVNENTEYQTVGISAGDDLSRASSESELLSMDNYSMITFDVPKIYGYKGGSTGLAGVWVYFGGQTLHYLLPERTPSTSSQLNLKFQIIKLPNTYKYRKYMDSLWGTWIDISPTDEQLSFVVYDPDEWSSFYLQFNNVRYNTLATSLASTTDYITSDADTSDSTITNMVPIVNYTGDGIGIQLTADGTNYEDVTNIDILRPTNTGTSSQIRILNQGVNIITEYGYKYNLY